MMTANFDFIRDTVRRRSGLILSREKSYLVESRLTPLARTHGHESLDGFVAALRMAPREDILADVTEAMTTNETLFFRDKTPFDLFRTTMLPGLTTGSASGRRLRVWSAAASTGQEPYSLAMVLKENHGAWSRNGVDILGTDLSLRALSRAEAGLYTQFEVQRGLPIQSLVRHFHKEGERWRIDETLRSMVRFSPFNLLDDMRPLGTFDIIFCRNVLIYFAPAARKATAERLEQRLTQNGFLVLGASETLMEDMPAFSPVAGAPGVYRKAAAGQVLTCEQSALSGAL